MISIAQQLQELAQEKQQNPQLKVIDKLLALFPFVPEEGGQSNTTIDCISRFGQNLTDIFYDFCQAAKNSHDFKQLVRTLNVSEAGQLIKNILYNNIGRNNPESAIELSRTVSQTLYELPTLKLPDASFLLINKATNRASQTRQYDRETQYYDTFCDFILKVAQWNWDIEEVLKKDPVPAQLASFIQRSYFATDLKSFAAELFLACPPFKDKMLSLDDPSLAQVINAYLYQEFDYRHRKGAPYDCEGIIEIINTFRQSQNTKNQQVGDALTTYLNTAIELGGCIAGLYPPNAYVWRISPNPSTINQRPIPEKMARIVEMFYQDPETSLQTCPSLQSILMNFSEYDLSQTVRAVLEQKAYRDIGSTIGNPEKDTQRDSRLEEIKHMIEAVQTFQMENLENSTKQRTG